MLKPTHRRRLLTALVLIPLVLGACLYGGWPYFGLLALALAGGLWEWTALAGGSMGPSRRLTAILAGLALLAGTRFYGPGAALFILAAVFWLETAPLTPKLARGTVRDPSSLPLTVGLVYLACPLALASALAPVEVLYVLCLTMASDTGAYYAGGLVGGPRLWPLVSPGKTWAGSLGGLTASLVVSLAYGLFFGAAGPWAFAALGLGLGFCVQWGDLFESALKRAAGVKDSGRLLPGHGGLLDRLDGLAPALAAYAGARMAWVFFQAGP